MRPHVAYEPPPARRLALGFVAAAATPVLIVAVLASIESGSFLNGFGFAAILSLYVAALTLFVGVPTLWLVQDRIAPTPLASVLAGCMASSPPGIIFGFVGGWRLSLELLVLSLPLGACGGLVFWFVALRGLKRGMHGGKVG